ncbi:hypothetical protein LTR70_009091, partial [Exophiala xenobiotica]
PFSSPNVPRHKIPNPRYHVPLVTSGARAKITDETSDSDQVSKPTFPVNTGTPSPPRIPWFVKEHRFHFAALNDSSMSYHGPRKLATDVLGKAIGSGDSDRVSKESQAWSGSK